MLPSFQVESTRHQCMIMTYGDRRQQRARAGTSPTTAISHSGSDGVNLKQYSLTDGDLLDTQAGNDQEPVSEACAGQLRGGCHAVAARHANSGH